MAKTLVLFFSVTGHTETLARAIAARLGGDIEAIRPQGSYGGALGAIRGIWQHITGSCPELLDPRDPTPYDLVVIGTPVWGGRLCAPVRSYLRLRGGSIRRLAGFWVSASGQAYAAVGSEMERLSGRPLLASHAFNDPEVKSGEFTNAVEAFARRASGMATSKSPGPTTSTADLSPHGPVIAH